MAWASGPASPTWTCTWLTLTRRWALGTESTGSEASSTMFRLTFCPSTPPAALTSARADPRAERRELAGQGDLRAEDDTAARAAAAAGRAGARLRAAGGDEQRRAQRQHQDQPPGASAPSRGHVVHDASPFGSFR